MIRAKRTNPVNTGKTGCLKGWMAGQHRHFCRHRATKSRTQHRSRHQEMRHKPLIMMRF